MKQTGAENPGQTALACPACRTQTLAERHLRNGLLVDVCTTCRGTWLDGGEILRLTKNHEGIQQSLVALEWDSRPSKRVCPRCSQKMVAGKFLGARSKIDYCQSCEGLWFDSTELKETLQTLALPPKERTTEQQPVDEDDPGETPNPAGAALVTYGVECSSCGSTRWVTPGQAGSIVGCAVCQESFRVPRQSETSQRDRALGEPVVFRKSAFSLFQGADGTGLSGLGVVLTVMLVLMGSVGLFLTVVYGVMGLGPFLLGVGVIGAVMLMIAMDTRCPSCSRLFVLKRTGKRTSRRVEFECNKCGYVELRRRSRGGGGGTYMGCGGHDGGYGSNCGGGDGGGDGGCGGGGCGGGGCGGGGD